MGLSRCVSISTRNSDSKISTAACVLRESGIFTQTNIKTITHHKTVTPFRDNTVLWGRHPPDSRAIFRDSPLRKLGDFFGVVFEVLGFEVAFDNLHGLRPKI